MTDAESNLPTDPQGEPKGKADKVSHAAIELAAGSFELVLAKHGQRYIFRYEPGGESILLADLVRMAQDPKSDIDWFDAAVLSHQMGSQISHQLQTMLKAS